MDCVQPLTGSMTGLLIPGTVKIMENVKSVSAGTTYTLAVRNDNTLWAWSSNGQGQLGDGTQAVSRKPVKIMDDVESASAMSGLSAAVKTDGSLWVWDNWYAIGADEAYVSRSLRQKR